MRRFIAAALLSAIFATPFVAQNKPRSLHIQGPQAFRLISLLVSGSNIIQSSLRDSGSNRIVLHDLGVLKFATFKYDEDASMYRLDLYSAQAKIGTAADPTQLNDATALYALLSSIGLTADTSMQGADFEADTVDCRINTHVPFDKPQRFVCDLALPF